MEFNNENIEPILSRLKGKNDYVASLSIEEKSRLRKYLRINLEIAQNKANKELQRKIVKILKAKFRNPCALFLDRILKIRSCNFIVEYILDIIFFWLPVRYRLTYNQIPLPLMESAKNGQGKLFLGRMISQKILKKIVQKDLPASNENLFIISMQPSEETYDSDGNPLKIPVIFDPSILGKYSLPKNVNLIRFAGGGVFDHCFTNAETGKTVTYAEMLFFLEKAREILSSGNSIYVHCWAGKERSVIFVMCYLMKYYGFTVEQASTYVKKHRILAKDFAKLKPEQQEFLTDNFRTEIE
jgi:hypothetical protein